MSLAIAFKGPEGIVLAADSRVTLTAQLAAGGETTSHFDNATKLLSVQGQPYVGIVTYGAGAIGSPGPRTAHGFTPEFEAQLSAKFPERTTVLEIATELGEFYNQQWQQGGMPAVGTPGFAPMVFLVAGFDVAEAYGKVFEISVPTAPAPVEQTPGDFGVTFGGQNELVARILNGVEPRVLELAKDELKLTDVQAGALYQRLRQDLAAPIPYQFLPLQDCVDLATFLVNMTPAVQGWTVGVRGVGGAVDVATLTRTEGFRGIQQKHIQVKE